MTASPRQWWDCLRLNARVARLALAQRWLAADGFARGYDRVAPYYDEAWQRHLRPVTDALLNRLPADLTGRILDLGCGTGYATQVLAHQFPESRIVAVDISHTMLELARQSLRPPRVEFIQADMLEFLSAQAANSARLIFSAWAIGYSRPAELFRQAARVLESGGTLMFIVNYADTLQPVFRAFRQCMQAFPDQVRQAAWLHFPRNWPELARGLERAGLRVDWHQDGFHPIQPPADAADRKLPWLLRTGVLAGFDQMLPLQENPAVAESFERCLRKSAGPLEHHYAAAMARQP